MDASDGTQAKPRFEPPPWERDAFEELARRRAAVEEAERLVAEARAGEEIEAGAAPAPEGPAAEPAADDGTPVVPWLAERVGPGPAPPEQGTVKTTAPVATQARTEGAQEAAPAAPKPKPDLDDRKVQAMLVQLAGEQQSVERAVRPVAGAAAGVMVLVGLGIAVAGIWGATRAGGNTLGMGGAVITAVLGCAFVGVGIWVWIRATRGKGSR